MALKENMEDMVVTNTLTLALWEHFHFKPNSRGKTFQLLCQTELTQLLTDPSVMELGRVHTLDREPIFVSFHIVVEPHNDV